MDSEQGHSVETNQQTSSSSSSSPSHPESFPSSPSSQKERSAPSSSASSSSSSAPFSPSSSPTNRTSFSPPHPIADSLQVTSCFNNSSTDVALASASTHHPNGLNSSPSSSSEVGPLNASNGTGDRLSQVITSDIGCQSSRTLPAGEPSDSIGTQGSFTKGKMASDQNKPGSTSDTQIRSESSNLNKSLTGAQKEDLLQGLALENVNINEGRSGHTVDYHDNNMFKDEQDTNLTNLSSLCRSPQGINGDHQPLTGCLNMITCGLESKANTTSTSQHRAAWPGSLSGYAENHNQQDLEPLRQLGENVSAQDTLHVSESGHGVVLEHACTSDAGSVGSQEIGEIWQLKATASAPAPVPMDIPMKDPPVEEPLISSPIVLDKVDTNRQVGSEASPGGAGLQRAQTMPSGSYRDADGPRSSNRKPGLMRSSTDKWKEQEDHDKENVRIIPAKLSKRKQKKLMKRIATVKKDGTVEFDVAPGLLGPEVVDAGEEGNVYEGDEDEERKAIPPLQIAMLIVGTRGDVQPFVAIGKHLQEHGHRVRLATHSNFRDFVLTAGLEFFPLGGDPKVLAEYMVKNKGFLPSGPSEIRTQRKELKSIINSLLPACTEPYEAGFPFKAQAIIANPPAYGHVHVAEALHVPLHIFFTMPWTATSEFPHPLSRSPSTYPAANRLSYQIVDSLIWWGIRGMINDFRKKKLKLRPITYLSGSQLSISKLPTGYIWSPHLVPKPKDWGTEIDVVGFCFLNLSQDYKPPDALVRWIDAGKKPIYVGFGSLPVEDPQGMTNIIVEALRKTSQRGIIDKGWGGIGNLLEPPDFVYLLENCPHDWLFPQCAAVVHHGGAGTTAAGLKAACPTTIVPFFGDQPFWGDRVHAKGVGPAPIPVGQFSLDKLVNAINFMLEPQVKQSANDLAEAMSGEDGVVGAVKAFHKHLPKDMPQTSPPSPPRSCLPFRNMLDCIFDSNPNSKTRSINFNDTG